MFTDIENHYATLGLDRGCTIADIRAAYRALAKIHHPDVNQATPDALARTQAINRAYKTLSDEVRRRIYDEEFERAEKTQATKFSRPAAANIKKDIPISIQELIRGVTLDVSVNDPANPSGAESYELVVPPETAPGTRFRLKRFAPFSSGFVLVRVKARPDARYRARGSDVRYELRINVRLATTGGTEYIRGPLGNMIYVKIPPKVTRGEIIRITGEGLPKTRGGRGDLLVRVMYRPEIRITRATTRDTKSAGRKSLMPGG